jgi:anti-sigma B factor antagonist
MSDLPQSFFATRTANNGQVVVTVGGECDLATLDRLNEVLGEAAAARPQELVVDLAQTTFIDSLTLGALTAAAKRVREQGGAFHLVRASAPEVRRALAVTGLDGYLR